MKDPEFARSIDGDNSGHAAIKPGAKTAVLIFGIAILLIILAGSFPKLMPVVGSEQPGFGVDADGSLNLTSLIIMLTLSAAGLIMLVTKTAATAVAKASLFTSMATAVVSVLGVVWMSATFMAANETVIEHAFSEVAASAPWTFAFALFLMGALTFSQAATTRTMMPMGLALGITQPHLLAMFPAVNGDFLLPGYPTLVAAIDFDRTGTTKVGKYVINHSFLLPGAVTLIVTVAMGFLLSSLLVK
jgi:anaerobic C4-dicarboxylate transporter DcuA